MSVVDDIKVANEIIDFGPIESVLFNDISPVYKCTNEVIDNPFYIDLISNKKEMLSVIGSGDQILNSVLFGSYNIDAFDISRFPKYFLDLKIAAIKSLTYDEYLSFFYDMKTFRGNLFIKVLNNMEKESKEFWTGVCSTKFLGLRRKLNEVYNSKIFENGFIPVSRAILINPYLKDERAYNNLKNRINNLNIRYYTGDIFRLDIVRENKYDLVNLSNICMYHADMQGFSKDSKYKEFVTSLNISKEGKVLSYLMHYVPGSISNTFYKKFFADDDRFKLYDVKKLDKHSDALLVYKKVR